MTKMNISKQKQLEKMKKIKIILEDTKKKGRNLSLDFDSLKKSTKVMY